MIAQIVYNKYDCADSKVEWDAMDKDAFEIKLEFELHGLHLDTFQQC